MFVQYIGAVLFIGLTVREFDDVKALTLVEAACTSICLKRVQPNGRRQDRQCVLKQFGTYTSANK